MGNNIFCKEKVASCNWYPGLDGTVEVTPKDLPRSPRDVFDEYTINRVLGKGVSGKVYAVVSNKTNEELALKVMQKDAKRARERYEQEVSILQSLDHPHIVKLHSTHEDNKYLSIATKLCVGGTLVARVRAGAHYSERVAATLLRDIVGAISYAHDLGIVHRDIKLRNIVFETESDDSRPIIIDWGESSFVADDDEFHDFIGTPVYLSPELARKRFGWELKKSDMWAIGVTAYVMLIGEPPFNGRTIRECIKQIRHKELKFPDNCYISKSAKTFIQQCMIKRTALRVSAKQALELDFLKNASEQSDVAIGMFMHHRLAEFKKATELQRLLINIQVQLMNSDDRRALKNMFENIRASSPRLGAGHADEISPEDLAEYLKNVNPYYCDESALDRAHKIIRASGKRSLDEHSMAQARVAQKMTQESHLRDVFNLLDKEDNGVVGADDMKRVVSISLKRKLSAEEGDAIKSFWDNEFGDENVEANDFVDRLKLNPGVSSFTWKHKTTQR